jgi:putative transposase
VRKAYLYRLYPTRNQEHALAEQLEEARVLYNAALQERRDAYRKARVSLNYYDQANQLKQVRVEGSLGLANFSACQDVLRRVDKTFKAFFRRVKAKEKPGYPRFKARTRYESFTFPSYGDGCRLLDTGRLRVQGVGCVKVKMHRPVVGQIKTVTIKRDAGRWYVSFSVECPATPLPPCDNAVGIDVGLASFATLSDGTTIENPRFLKRSLSALRRAQRKVARRHRGIRRRRKAVGMLQRAHLKVRNQRKDFHHKTARQLVNQYDTIFFEHLNITGLARGFLARAVHDVAWGTFLSILANKAEEAGRESRDVPARGTSQRCPCGASVPKALGDRWHQCEQCGLSVPRDHASALEILRLGLGCSLQDITGAAGLSVS